jgi:hypothetical protein
MLQFYFLSIMLNLISGMILVYGKNLISSGTEKHTNDEGHFLKELDDTASGEKKDNSRSSVKNTMTTVFGENTIFDDKTFRLVLGILTMFVGLMKLLSVVHNDVPIIGDLLPAVAGLLGGFCLLVEFYRQNSTAELKLPDFIQRLFVEDRRYLGILCIVAAILHFVFPDVLLL